MIKTILLGKYRIFIEITKRSIIPEQPKFAKESDIIKVNIGPGPNWLKPDSSWVNVDVDPDIADICMNFESFERFPFNNNSVSCIYGSHVFEHISINKTPLIFADIYRILEPNGVFRAVIPDVKKSLMEYLEGNKEFLLFKRRRKRAQKHQNKNYTLFECLREDFLSPASQKALLGQNSLAHQNAWDITTFKTDLIRAGFKPHKIKEMDFQKSDYACFDFEGDFESEANEDYRSIYIEAKK